MTGAKKILSVVFLLAVAAALAAYALRERYRPAEPPAAIRAEMVEKIDIETLEVVTQSLGDWRKGGAEHGMYKNPQTGKFTMLPSTMCPHCQGRIPISLDATAVSYPCPRCKQNVFKPPMQGRRP